MLRPAGAPAVDGRSEPERDEEDGAPAETSGPAADEADDPQGPWDAERFKAALAPFFAEYPEIVFTPDARRHQWTQLKETGERTWKVVQTLLDPEGDNLWAIEGEIDLRDPEAPEGPLVRLVRIGP